MRYLVTGSSGFIGNHMVKFLLDKGHTVFSIDRNKGDQTQYVADIRNFNIEKLIEKVDVVFHFAATVGVKKIADNKLDCYYNNP